MTYTICVWMLFTIVVCFGWWHVHEEEYGYLDLVSMFAIFVLSFVSWFIIIPAFILYFAYRILKRFISKYFRFQKIN
jgi:hypothetical protein